MKKEKMRLRYRIGLAVLALALPVAMALSALICWLFEITAYSEMVGVILLIMIAVGLWLLFHNDGKDPGKPVTRLSRSDVAEIAGRYFRLEDYRPEDSLPDSALRAILHGDRFMVTRVRGSNLMTGTWRGRRLETGFARLETMRNFFYNTQWCGQVCILEAEKPFPGKLLLVRPYVKPLSSKEDQKGRVPHALHYNLVYAARLTDDRITVSRKWDAKWDTFSEDKNAALTALTESGELYKQLMDLEDMHFVLYDGDRIAFGGDYGMGSQLPFGHDGKDALRKDVDRKLASLFNGAVAAVDSIKY